MPTRTGKCANFGICTKADNGETIVVPDGSDFRCPECKKELRPAAGSTNGGGGGVSPVIFVIAGVIAILALGGWYWFSRSKPTPPTFQDGKSIGSSGSIPFTPSSKGSANVILRLHGSNTIGAELAPALAKEYLRGRGATDAAYVPSGTANEGDVIGYLPGQTRPVDIEIHAKGSTTGFADLGSGSADIAMSSRKIKSEEKEKLSSLGDLEAYGSENVIGLDGVAIIVHASNPISNLTRDQVRGIFSGETTNWRDLGGNAGDIDVYARPPASSGTFETFNNLVLTPAKLTTRAKQIDDSQQLSDAVARDVNAIGFIGLPYVHSAKALGISDHGTRPLLPNPFTIGREDYLLSRRLFLYVPPKIATAEAQNFTRFALSEAGQAIVNKIGFIGQTVTQNTSLTQPDGSAPLSLDFRFRTGSAALDNKALADLERVVTFARSAPSMPKLLLLGYTDNVGSPDANKRLSIARASSVASELKTRGLNVAGTAGFGADSPVASNDTPEGREQNRRVEIWTKR